MSLATRRAIFADTATIAVEPSFEPIAGSLHSRNDATQPPEPHSRPAAILKARRSTPQEGHTVMGWNREQIGQSQQFESQHPRGGSGRFTTKTAPEPAPFAPLAPVQSPSGAWGFPPDPRFPEELAEFTTDFGPCPCGQGQMLLNDHGEVHHEDGYAGYTISCSTSGDLLGGVDYDIDPDTGDLTGGRAQWYEPCSQGDLYI